jgi:hypothetical protein
MVRPRTGRPPKAENDSRGYESEHVAVRMTRIEKERLVRVAEARGLSLSEALRAGVVLLEKAS